MSRKLLFVVLSVLYLILIAFGLTLVYSVGNPVSVKQVITAQDNKISIAHTEIFGKLQRPQVIFDHKKHEDAYKTKGCKSCHPVNDKNELVFAFPKKVKGTGGKAFMKAFHDECIDCHKKEKKGPVECNNCHKKEFASVNIKYPKAEFDFVDHDKHMKSMKVFGAGDCGSCHHTYDMKEKKLTHKQGTEESCSYCHDLDKKRGPELAAITKVAAEKGLSIRKVSHQQCLDCHLEYQAKYLKMDKKEVHTIHREKLDCKGCHVTDSKHAVSCSECHIPTECSKCHTGKYRTVAELKNVARPNRGQKDVTFISAANSKMKGVPFNHRAHEAGTKSCRGCHHETLKACDECHSLTGKPEGNGINIAKAYHRAFSGQSCAGCHNAMKTQKECAGCHYFIASTDVETMGPKKDTCARCHSGGKEAAMPKPLSAGGAPKEVTVSVLEKEYEPATFPHGEIVDKLARISNNSRLATYFHRDGQTLCAGCHHRSPVSAQQSTPQCRNCHMIAADKGNLNDVRLLTAYHNQCMGCHDKMGIDKGNSGGDRCTACHKRKAGAVAEMTQIKNQSVVKQNKTTILNVWHPK